MNNITKEIVEMTMVQAQVTVVKLNGETYWVAKEIADILEYEDSDNWQQTNNMLKLISEENIFDRASMFKKVKKLPHQISVVKENFKFPVHHNTKLINEDGLFEAIFGSKKAEAKLFKKEVIAIIKKIALDGFYISEEVKAKPTEALVKELHGIAKTRQALYFTRSKLMEKIAKFLYGTEWESHSMAAQMSRLHQYCHVALTMKTAQGVIEHSVKENEGKAVIHSYLNMDKRDSPIQADYITALNYYNESDLVIYLDYFNTALARVGHHIDAKHITPTTASVIKMLNEIGLDVVKASTPLGAGDSIATKNRKEFNDIMYQIGSGALTREEFLDECDKLSAGSAFIL